MMKALVYHGPQEIYWQDWPDPEPGPGEVIIAIRAVGICGSDLRAYKGDSTHRTSPMVMGHEASGEVVALGANVPQDKLGLRVVIRPDLICEACEKCLAGRTNLCHQRQLLGVHTQGAMAQRLAVPVSNLLPLPEEVSFVHGILVEPLAVGIHAVSRAGDLSGRSVLIAGSGPIGLLTLIAVRQAGARFVAQTDIIPKRLKTARALGAHAAVDTREQGWVSCLNEALGDDGGVDVAFDAVGMPETFEQAMLAVRPGGIVVAVAGWRTVPLNMSYFVRREIDLRATFNYTRVEFDKACLWLKERRFDADLLVTNVYPLAQGATAFAELAQDRSDKVKVVLESSE
ncbi:MAG: zinc-dependent alcohol dehydrogenase [Anaerolineae bacterium]